MLTRLLLVAALLTTLVSSKKAFDDEFEDEFASEGQVGASSSSSSSSSTGGADSSTSTLAEGSSAGSAPSSTAPVTPLDLSNAWGKKDWTIEILGGIGLLAYLGISVYMHTLAQKDVSVVEGAIVPFLSRNFARLGTGKGKPAFSNQSSLKHELWASGRAHCEGALVTLSLKSRLDIMSIVKNAMPGAAQTVSKTMGGRAATSADLDLLRIEIPLDAATSRGCVFGLAPAADIKALVEARPDIAALGKEQFAASRIGFPESSQEIRTEHKDVTACVMKAPSMVAFMKAYPTSLLELIVTDIKIQDMKPDFKEESMTPFATSDLSNKTVSATVELPASRSQWPKFAGDFLEAILHLTDRLSSERGVDTDVVGAPLSAAAVEATKKNRDAYEAKLGQLQREAQRRIDKEQEEAAAEKAREKRVQAMSSKERAAFEAKEKAAREKEEKKEAQKKGKKLAKSNPGLLQKAMAGQLEMPM